MPTNELSQLILVNIFEIAQFSAWPALSDRRKHDAKSSELIENHLISRISRSRPFADVTINGETAASTHLISICTGPNVCLAVAQTYDLFTLVQF